MKKLIILLLILLFCGVCFGVIAPLYDPFAVHDDGTDPLTGNWNVGGYNISGVNDFTAVSLIIDGNSLDTNEWGILNGITANMILDWTNTTANFKTTGTGIFRQGLLGVEYMSVDLSDRILYSEGDGEIGDDILDWSERGLADFQNNKIETSGTGEFGNLDVDTLNLNGNVISDSGGTISFDNDNLTAITNLTVSTLLTAKTQGTATFVIAANDSTAASKAHADYVCDGTDDEVQINAAIQSLTGGYSAAQGGSIELSEGDFVISAPIVLDRNFRFTGQGSELTRIYLANGSDCNMVELTTPGNSDPRSLSYIGHLELHGNGDNNAAGSDGIWQSPTNSHVDTRFFDIWFEDINGVGISLANYWNHQISYCTFEHLDTAIELRFNYDPVYKPIMLHIHNNMAMVIKTFLTFSGTPSATSQNSEVLVHSNVIRATQDIIKIGGNYWNIADNIIYAEPDADNTYSVFEIDTDDVNTPKLSGTSINNNVIHFKAGNNVKYVLYAHGTQEVESLIFSNNIAADTAGGGEYSARTNIVYISTTNYSRGIGITGNLLRSYVAGCNLVYLGGAMAHASITNNVMYARPGSYEIEYANTVLNPLIAGNVIEQGINGSPHATLRPKHSGNHGIADASPRQTIANDDATPDVSSGNMFEIASDEDGTAITDLDNPTLGQIVYLIGGGGGTPMTIADAGFFTLSAAWTAGANDVLVLYVKADNWYIELSRSDN